jgi:hypothetical protein
MGGLFEDIAKNIGKGIKDATQRGVNDGANRTIDKTKQDTTTNFPDATKGTTQGMANDVKGLARGAIDKLFNPKK